MISIGSQKFSAWLESRKARGETLRQIAARLNVVELTLRNASKGKYTPRTSFIVRVLPLCGATLTDWTTPAPEGEASEPEGELSEADEDFDTWLESIGAK